MVVMILKIISISVGEEHDRSQSTSKFSRVPVDLEQHFVPGCQEEKAEDVGSGAANMLNRFAVPALLGPTFYHRLRLWLLKYQSLWD
jgi:hypothetical protein